VKKLIFEDLLAPSSKPELWLPHDERASANLWRKLLTRPWIVKRSVEIPPNKQRKTEF